MESYIFFNDLDQNYLQNALGVEEQFSATIDALIDAEIITPEEAESYYTSCLSVKGFVDFKVMGFQLRNTLRTKILDPTANHKLVLETILYSIIDQSKFNEFKTAANHLLYPCMYNASGELKLTRDEILLQKRVPRLDWKKLLNK